MKRIGMLTSGGDCQALNAAMRGVVKGLSENVDELEIYGFHNGYKGLIYGDYRLLTSADFSGILTKGGTILGSSRQPFKQMRVPDENGLDKVEAMKQTYHKLNLDCLVILGGNGTQKTANLLREEGLNVVHLPKTIDNDSSLTKKAYKAKVADRKYPSVSYEIADQIYEAAGVEVRVTVPGHTQRGGSPCPYDRVLCTRLGSAAAQAIIEEDYGCMIAMINGETKRVPLAEVSGKLKTVDPDCQMIQEAKRIGISFGD